MSAKFHLAITSGGQVVEGFLSGGSVNDIGAAPELVQEVAGCAVMADRGYDSDKFRKLLKGNNNEPGHTRTENRKEPIEYDQELYKNVDISGGYLESSKKTGGLRYGMKNQI
jgi:hypothetical protein